MVDRVDMDLTGVDKMVCMVISKMVTSELVKTFCEEYFHFSSLVVIGGICGLVLLLWVVFRFKNVLKQTYCGCLYKHNSNIQPDLRARLYSVNYLAPHTSRSWSDVTGMTGVMSRVQAYRKNTPPPPYEAPPSYQVAVQMEDPPGYQEREYFIT